MAEETQKENQKRRAGRQPSQDASGQPSQEVNEQTPPAQGALDAAKPLEPGDVEPALTEPAAAKGGGEVFEIAVLPLQQTTLFPGTVIPLSAARPRSVAAVEAAIATPEELLAFITVAQGKAGPGSKAPPPHDLYQADQTAMVK